jgi:prepilin peptidase CpaA
MFAGTKETIEVIYAAAASVAAMVAAGNYLKSRRIPNALTGSSLICGLGLHLSTGGFRELYLSALAGLLVGGVFAVLYAAGGMGAGDVKLMAAVGCLAAGPCWQW